VKVGDALREGKVRLRDADLDLSELEAESLLQHILGLDRAGLFRDLGQPIGDVLLASYRKLLDRRCAHEPTAYIIGHREFFGLDLRVTPAALIPRPETEALVQSAIDFVRSTLPHREVSIVDVGTGSGAIAISLAANLPNAIVTATDLSSEALDLARGNAEANGVADRVRFVQGDLLELIHEPVDVIAANLPYVTSSEWQGLPLELKDNEPKLALEGGADGLDLVRRLLAQAPARLAPGGALFEEVGDGHASTVLSLAAAAFPDARIEMAPDLAGTPRVLCVYS